MNWLASLNKGAGAGEVQLTYNPDQGTIDIATHLGASPKFSSVAQEDASAFLQAELRSARLGLPGSNIDDLVARAIETGYAESPIVAAYMIPEFPDRDKRAGREELAEFLFAVAENLTNSIISGVQFDRSDFGKYIVSGLPDNYYQYVALVQQRPPLNQRDTAKVAALVRANVESYVNNSLLTNGASIRYGQITSEIYSISTAYAGLADSAEQLVGVVKAALDRDLSEAERTLVEAVYIGDQAAIMETLWEVSPEGAEMVPRGLPAPIMPGQTYTAKKHPIPIKLVGQWAKEPPDSWYEKIRGRTPETEEVPEEPEKVLKEPKWRTRIPAWKRSWNRIVSYAPSRAVELALEEVGTLSEDPPWEEARDFMRVLRDQKYLGTRSKGYVEWWLQNWGAVPPEELYAPEEEVPEEPEPEFPIELEAPYVPWTQQ